MPGNIKKDRIKISTRHDVAKIIIYYYSMKLIYH